MLKSCFQGTVITIHANKDANFGSSIVDRLRHRDGLLRSSPDPSLLVQSILDIGKTALVLDLNRILTLY